MRERGSADRSLLFPLLFAAFTGLVYFLSNPHPKDHYDYTFRVAESLLNGRLGLVEQPPAWLNEFVPLGGEWYSVFPFGAVLTMAPVALLKLVGVINEMPGSFLAALCAAAVGGLMTLIADRYNLPFKRKLLLAAALPFGTWTWVNLTFAGAWQLALGFAMVGELGAIYFTAFDRRPLLAGMFFALAFGNRTEVLVTAPIFYFWLARSAEANDRDPTKLLALRWMAFSIVPAFLGFATLYYNYVRFGSIFDFGYARIPDVLSEPWYAHGIFSPFYIPHQAYEMLLKPWLLRGGFPYLIPNGFGNSVLWSSPFLLFIFRRGAKELALKACAWGAITSLSLILWAHGNSGGWQFAFRYGMILLPWILLILVESSPKKTTGLEWAVYGFSFAANVYALWLFHWTLYVKP